MVINFNDWSGYLVHVLIEVLSVFMLNGSEMNECFRRRTSDSIYLWEFYGKSFSVAFLPVSFFSCFFLSVIWPCLCVAIGLSTSWHFCTTTKMIHFLYLWDNMMYGWIAYYMTNSLLNIGSSFSLKVFSLINVHLLSGDR